MLIEIVSKICKYVAMHNAATNIQEYTMRFFNDNAQLRKDIWQFAQVEYGREAPYAYHALLEDAIGKTPSRMTRIKAFFAKIVKPYDADIAYLEESTDHCDLERRMQKLRAAGRM
jgi:hypothetical protein